jgi:hypothetical protein
VKATTLLLVGILGLALAAACSSTSPVSDGDGTGGAGGRGGAGGSGGTVDAGCKYLHYFSAGCDVAPTCFNGTGGACLGLACGCNGKIVAGCANEFAEPYAYTVPASVDPGIEVGAACDPTADAGR